MSVQIPATQMKPSPPKRNCLDCLQFLRSSLGPRCRFRGAQPRGICSMFKRRLDAAQLNIGGMEHAD